LKVLDLTKVKQSILIARFIQKAKLIFGINSLFVVKIYEHGLTEDYGFIVMEFFSRGDLKQRMELKITPEIAFNYMTHITCGRDDSSIHSIDVIHKDLKPVNIMFRGDDSLTLVDFGIPKKLGGDIGITTVKQVLEIPHYMNPEQGEGKSVDARSDLYSAEVLLYELLTEDKPFKAKTPTALICQHVHGTIPRSLAKKP